uniref:Glutamate--tRNA ligase, mitochondrial n=1 Tax=Blastobotrys adeninivorans TaxID=409370 RepID=A0A060T361_BLAAD
MLGMLRSEMIRARQFHTFRPLLGLRSSKLRQVQATKAPEAVETQSIHPTAPARTRFAPSPTGFLHLGSLRTALYNYLLAKNTGGQFILRLEDTDQERLVPEAEQNIYEYLTWAGIHWDEGPDKDGPYGPYKQSERTEIYNQHIGKLLDSGHAYRCFCSKSRLDSLRDSARKLYPPSLASYDRKCTNLSRQQSDDMAAQGQEYTIRFKSPTQYPEFEDLLHGKLNLQTQVNYQDLRYEDPVLIKSDGLPTYHFANVVDDHLMKITHVIRGEEWLLSGPKHVALYDALGWTAPKFVHIPLLTSASDKKLSKRSGDSGVSSLRDRGILPEALVNFVALFGWSPTKSSNAASAVVDGQPAEAYTIDQLVSIFDLNGLTKGNAKVDDRKLLYFNKYFFQKRLQDDSLRPGILDQCKELIKPYVDSSDSDIADSIRKSDEYLDHVLSLVGLYIQSPQDFQNRTEFFFKRPNWDAVTIAEKDRNPTRAILVAARDLFKHNPDLDTLIKSGNFDKKQVFTALRYALAGGIPGLRIPQIMKELGTDICLRRIENCIQRLSL